MAYNSKKTNHIGGVEVGGGHASLAACAARAARTRQVNIQRLKLLMQRYLADTTWPLSMNDSRVR